MRTPTFFCLYLAWQNHTPDLNLPLTPDLCAGLFLAVEGADLAASPSFSVNNPVAIWEAVTAKLLV
jgi:hypothetical protein